MSTKRWSGLFISIICIAVAFIMLVNYIVDPFKYFSSQHGDDYTLQEDEWLRELKAEHIKYFSDEYDAYFIAGSKGGAVLTSKLKELDGYDYYNCWLLSGNFSDYLAYIRFIVENTDAKKILLQISTSELRTIFGSHSGTIYWLPSVVSGESKFVETMKILMKNPRISFRKIVDDGTDHPCLKTGERDLQHYYDYQNKDLKKFRNNIITSSEVYYKYFLGDMERLDLDAAVTENIAILKEIKSVCDEHGVELQVYFASLFLPQLMRFESEEYYNFLEEVVMVCDNGNGVWNFNTYNDVAACPYNYYNPDHFFYDVADEMIETMKTGNSTIPGFGQLLTRENIGNIIAERRALHEKYLEYYLENEDLPYEKYDSEYNLTKSSIHNNS